MHSIVSCIPLFHSFHCFIHSIVSCIPLFHSFHCFIHSIVSCVPLFHAFHCLISAVCCFAAGEEAVQTVPPVGSDPPRTSPALPRVARNHRGRDENHGFRPRHRFNGVKTDKRILRTDSRKQTMIIGESVQLGMWRRTQEYLNMDHINVI